MMEKIQSTNYLSFYSNWAQLLLDHVVAPFEIAIVGKDAMPKRAEMAENYLGNSILLGTEKEENLDLLKEKLQEDYTMIYVCQNKTCKLPLEDCKEAIKLVSHDLK